MERGLHRLLEGGVEGPDRHIDWLFITRKLIKLMVE